MIKDITIIALVALASFALVTRTKALKDIIFPANIT